MPQTRRWHVLSRTGEGRMVTYLVEEMLGGFSTVAQVKLSPPVKIKLRSLIFLKLADLFSL